MFTLFFTFCFNVDDEQKEKHDVLQKKKYYTWLISIAVTTVTVVAQCNWIKIVYLYLYLCEEKFLLDQNQRIYLIDNFIRDYTVWPDMYKLLI